MKTNYKQLLDVLGSVGIMASLIFVGMQLSFDRKVAISEQYGVRAETSMANARARMESGSYMITQRKFWETGFRPSWWSEELEELSISLKFDGADVMSMYESTRLGVLQLDNAYFQAQQGIGSISLATIRTELEQRLKDPFSRVIYLDTSITIRV